MIEERIDSKRGCGWRQPGGLYLVSSGESVTCGKLPVPLTICPTCGGGIHFARSWTWVDGNALLSTKICNTPPPVDCFRCMLEKSLGRCGLLWIGEKFYKTPAEWTNEAEKLGVSRRIPAVPREFQLGKTVVLVAHIKAIKSRCATCTGFGSVVLPSFCPNKTCEAGFTYAPGIFSAFLPTAVEYVTNGTETDEELESLSKRGITPIKIMRTEGD